MSKRISSLTAGERVVLSFATSSEPLVEEATFLLLSDDGERAEFHTDREGGGYDWSAYRFQGRWCYGSSAQRLSVVSVIA